MRWTERGPEGLNVGLKLMLSTEARHPSSRLLLKDCGNASAKSNVQEKGVNYRQRGVWLLTFKPASLC